MRKSFSIFGFFRLILILICSVLMANVCHASMASPPYVADIAGAKDSMILTYNRDLKGRIACYDIGSGHIRWQRRISQIIWANTLTSASLVYIPNEFILDLKDGSIRKQFSYAESPQCVTFTPDLFVTSRRVEHADQMLVAYDTTSFRKLWQSRLKYCDVYKIISRGNEFDVLITDPQFFMQNEPDRKEDATYASRTGTVRHPSFRVAAIDVPGTSYYVDSFRIIMVRASDGQIVKDSKVKNFNGLYNGGLFGEDDRLIPETLPSSIKRSVFRLFGTLEYPHYPIERTRLAQGDDLWFIGKINHDLEKGTVFALNGDTGKIAWKHEVAGLQEILAYKGKLVAASFMAYQYGPNKPSKKNKLVALDVETGKVCWTTVVAD